MNFANLSPLWVGAGLAGLAGLLYMMQHLRVRYREIPVATTMFWRAALEEAPVRVFKQRFRHFWAYLLILAICSLIWVSFADPRWEGEGGEQSYVLLLDGSAGMARGNAFEKAVDQLKKDISSMPADRRQVLWVGGHVKTLLAPGEHVLLLDKRLESLAPEAAPSSLERELRQLAMVSREDAAATILIYGDAPVRQQVLDMMPATYKIQRAAEAELESGNRGITALGVSEALSGKWDRVDVLIKLESDEDQLLGAKDVKITLNGQTLENVSFMETGKGAFMIKDVPAKGGLLKVALLEEDILSLDNTAELRLPERPMIRVQLSPSLSSLRTVLGADRAVELVTEKPDVVIKRKGEAFGGDVATLEFVPQSEQDASFKLIYPGDEDSTELLGSAVQALGLNQIDATSLAGASQKPISISAEGGDAWRFAVWEELLGNDYNFVQSRSFPLFMAKSIRWLAQTKSWHPYVAAGSPLVTNGFGDRNVLGVNYVPAAGGKEGKLVVSLLDPAITAGNIDGAVEVKGASLGTVLESQDFVTWLLLLALLLLSAEWYFYQKGRMP